MIFLFPEFLVQMVTGRQFHSQMFSSSHRLQQQIPRISFLQLRAESDAVRMSRLHPLSQLVVRGGRERERGGERETSLNVLDLPECVEQQKAVRRLISLSSQIQL